MLNPALPDVLKIIMMEKELYISLTNNAVDHKYSEFSPTVPSPSVGKAEKIHPLVVWLIIITSKFYLFAITFFPSNEMKMEIACKGSTVLQTKLVLSNILKSENTIKSEQQFYWKRHCMSHRQGNFNCSIENRLGTFYSEKQSKTSFDHFLM